MCKIDKAREKHEQSLEMYFAILGYRNPHPEIAKSLKNLGILYETMGKLDKGLEKLEQSLEMKRDILGRGKP